MDVTKKDKSNNKIPPNVSYTVESFGKKLIELRNERGITQAESAEMIGISRNALSMYERCERCPNIDIAVNTANAYGVSLDYLFGTGYKKQKNNEYNMFEMGFSEKSLDFLISEENRYYVDAILSDSRIQKISDMLYGSYYKPLINSYEMNYISRLISDLLYCILVDVTKGVYKLRPMLEDDAEELSNAIDSCIHAIKSGQKFIYSDFDSYEDCHETIESELEKIKNLLYDSCTINYNQAKQEGFSEAVKMFASGDIAIAEPLTDEELHQETPLTEYIKKIPLKDQISMTTSELFETAKHILKNQN